VTEYGELLRRLVAGGVEFIVIGGVAASAHGSPRFTQDVDVVYRRTPENLARIVEALGPVQPYLRGAPPGLPFRFDLETLRRGLNFTFTTTLGAIDILGEVVGAGSYEALLPHSARRDAFGVTCQVVNLRKLIDLKRAAGRPKDFEAIAELELLLTLGAP
jgi:predicted nucleotidyltransferase